MGIFQHFPYTNFHELNLDWFLGKFTDLLTEWATYHAQWDKWQGDITQIVDDLEHWFDDLDLSEEVKAVIDEMVESGEFIQIIAEYLPYVTPEMFGAVGDGVTDDTQAWSDAIATAKPVIASEKTYAVQTINIATTANIYGNNCTLKAIGTAAWVSPINAANADSLLIRDINFVGIGIPTDTQTYHSVIEARNIDTVLVDHITINNFYNRTPEVVGNVDERHAVMFTFVDCINVDIINSELYNVAGGELCYISETSQALEDAAVINFRDNYIHDISDLGLIKASSFNLFAGVVHLENNIIERYITDYTYFNLKGSLIFCTGNKIKDGMCEDVFDTYESGYLDAETLIVENNNVECQNATLIKFRGSQATVKNNYFKGNMCFFGTSGYRTDTIFDYPTKGAFDGCMIEICNNALDLGWIDEYDKVGYPFMPWGIGSFSGLQNGNNLETLIIRNNTIDMSVADADSPRETRSAFLEMWNNINNIVVEDNTLIDPVRSEISATLYFWLVMEAVTTRTVKKIVFQNNTLSDSALTSQSLYIRKDAGYDDDTVPVIASMIDLFNVNAAGAIDSNISNVGNLLISNFLTTRTSTVVGAVNHYVIPLNA